MKIMSFVLVLILLFSVCVSASAQETSAYKDEVFALLELDYPREEYCYSEKFFYYGENATADEATPDYVMVLVHYAYIVEIQEQSYIGDYVVSTALYSPYLHGYHFYIPAEDKLLTLEEAINSDLEGVEEALKNISHSVALVGDCDSDFELTIKDATCVQKYIAGLDTPNCALYDYEYLVYDFDKDADVNIKDATAIQKHIAGLEY